MNFWREALVRKLFSPHTPVNICLQFFYILLSFSKVVFQQVSVLGSGVNKLDKYKELVFGGEGQKKNKYTHKILSILEVSKCNSEQ